MESDLSPAIKKVVLSQTMTNPAGFAWEVLPGGDHELLWAVDTDTNKVVRVAVSGGFRREYNVAGGVNLESIFFNNVTRKLWALNTNGKTLYRGFDIVGTGAAATLDPHHADRSRSTRWPTVPRSTASPSIRVWATTSRTA